VPSAFEFLGIGYGIEISIDDSDSDPEVLRTFKQKFDLIWPHLDERVRRMVAANEARQLGYGGISKVSRACGLSRLTIAKGIQEFDLAPPLPDRTRRPGAGRPGLLTLDPDLPQDFFDHGGVFDEADP
jgi:hypothetical protein